MLSVVRRSILPAIVVTLVIGLVYGVGFPLFVTAVGKTAFATRANGSLIKRNGQVVGSSLIGQNFLDDKGNPDPRYFQPRPSAAGNGYDPTASGASNLGPGDPRLVGFQPGFNTVDLDGNPSKTNPFATKDDPYCVPTDPGGAAVASPSTGQKYAKNDDGSYVCYPSTVPERTAAYRHLNGLDAKTLVPVDAVTASASGLDPDISIANALLQAPRVAAARNLPATTVVDLVKARANSQQLGFLGEKTVNVLDINLALDALKA
jgi:K+-transporting ATPase ATPase C chain